MERRLLLREWSPSASRFRAFHVLADVAIPQCRTASRFRPFRERAIVSRLLLLYPDQLFCRDPLTTLNPEDAFDLFVTRSKP